MTANRFDKIGTNGDCVLKKIWGLFLKHDSDCFLKQAAFDINMFEIFVKFDIIEMWYCSKFIRYNKII